MSSAVVALPAKNPLAEASKKAVWELELCRRYTCTPAIALIDLLASLCMTPEEIAEMKKGRIEYEKAWDFKTPAKEFRPERPKNPPKINRRPVSEYVILLATLLLAAACSKPPASQTRSTYDTLANASASPTLTPTVFPPLAMRRAITRSLLHQNAVNGIPCPTEGQTQVQLSGPFYAAQPYPTPPLVTTPQVWGWSLCWQGQWTAMHPFNGDTPPRNDIGINWTDSSTPTPTITPGGPTLTATATITPTFTPSNTATPTPITPTPTQVPLPAPWGQADVGTTLSGSASISGATWTVTGDGADIQGAADAFHFVFQPVSGDGTQVMRVVSQTNTNIWAKAGPMYRATTDAGSVEAGMFVTPSQGVTFQWRSATGGGTLTIDLTTGGAAPRWLKLTRAGGVFTGYYSADNVTWTQVGTATLTNMPVATLAGMAVSSHSATSICTVVIDNVAISGGPPPATGTPTIPPTSTPTMTATAVPPTATRTNTASPTATRTATAVPPTSTPTRTATVPPTATRTATPVPPTATATFTFTPTRTATAVPPTFTATATQTFTPVPPTATATQTATVPPTAIFTPTTTPTMTDLEEQNRIRALEHVVYTPTP